jgi:methylmalonyl-CoA/ethylmalonyl-CoA epimerase
MLDHIAIATRDTAKMRRIFEMIGFRAEKVEDIPTQGVTATFLSLDGVHVELLEPTREDSPVARVIAKRGEGLHHLAFTVASLEEAMKTLRAGGLSFAYDAPQPGAADKKINFLHPRDCGGVLIELCE